MLKKTAAFATCAAFFAVCADAQSFPDQYGASNAGINPYLDHQSGAITAVKFSVPFSGALNSSKEFERQPHFSFGVLNSSNYAPFAMSDSGKLGLGFTLNGAAHVSIRNEWTPLVQASSRMNQEGTEDAGTADTWPAATVAVAGIVSATIIAVVVGSDDDDETSGNDAQ